MSNPIALLVQASEESQSTQRIVDGDDTGLRNTTNLACALLRRPGYVSLGLNLRRDILEEGLDSLFTHASQSRNIPTLFASSSSSSQARDLGPNLDPVNLGLVSMDEVCRLFAIYFERLHPFNAILDPILHTPDFVRSRSALLFTWILALAAPFETDSSMVAKRLVYHGNKLSRYVYSQGLRSIEIIQGYYISLISDRPIDQSFQETSWMYKAFAFGMAAELGLHRPWNDQAQAQGEKEDELRDRIARSEQRTWLRMLTWERAQEAALGRMKPILQGDLSFIQLDSWWMHPLADAQDRNACATLHFRNLLALIYEEVRRKMSSDEPRENLHWVKNYVDSVLEPWRASWLPDVGEAYDLSDAFLSIVFMYGRLWTLSFALSGPQNAHLEYLEVRTTMEDCFEAAIRCCEESLGFLDRIGEPLYCMNTPVWVMISYAGVLSMKLFQFLYGAREGNNVEVVALVTQVALQLERAGNTPAHRLGVSAIFGQQLFLTLRSYASSLGGLAMGSRQTTQRQDDRGAAAAYQDPASRDGRSPAVVLDEMPWPIAPPASTVDPFLMTPLFPDEETFPLDESLWQLFWK
ncbi:hypothetical protein GQ53DRAFT_741939 [Thozetella sp. PMI_491]|nr:hypothetical protein GQ53DRAFT_741939 [Thozetella sp. PMI_491]